MFRWTILLIFFSRPIVAASECIAKPLGMESRLVPDSGISASSEWNANHGATNARLNFQAGGGRTGAWSAKSNDVNQWLKVNLGRPVRVTHIQTQGREDCCNQWVTSYAVSYSQDNKQWHMYTENGQEKVFQGNKDKKTVVTQELPSSILAQYIRIHPRSWHDHVSMRAEFLGCQSDCIVEALGMESKAIPDSRISASSEWNANHGATNARLNFQAGGGRTGAWSAKSNDVNQWLKVDLGQPSQVTHIQIQGREDCCNQFVKTYAVSYSQDNNQWQMYMQNGQEKIFRGSSDLASIVTDVLSPSITTRYIRIHPRSWNEHISMRVEFLGCKIGSWGSPCDK